MSITDTTPLSPRSLSPRHEPFVAAFLEDGDASQAQRAGIVELWVSSHNKQEQRVQHGLGSDSADALRLMANHSKSR